MLMDQEFQKAQWVVSDVKAELTIKTKQGVYKTSQGLECVRLGELEA